MKRLFALSALTLALLSGASHAQSSPPPLPALTAEQSASVNERLDAYRQETERRVARGEITRDEADNLLAWREWQVARQVSGSAAAAPPDDVPPDYTGDVARDDAPNAYYVAPPRRDYVVVSPAPYYGPYYYRYPVPYYYGPYPYAGPSVCAGGFGHHVGGRICF